jgi:F0F1-type ATP synthase membrane subunit b/b'
VITPDWTLAVAAAIFLITLAGLNQLLFRPLFSVLDARESLTTESRKETQALLQKYQSLLGQSEERIKEEKQQGYRLAEAQRNQAVQERQRQIAQARTRMEALLQGARNQIREETETARSEIVRNSEEAAQMIAARIFGRR